MSYICVVIKQRISRCLLPFLSQVTVINTFQHVIYSYNINALSCRTGVFVYHNMLRRQCSFRHATLCLIICVFVCFVLLGSYCGPYIYSPCNEVMINWDCTSPINFISNQTRLNCTLLSLKVTVTC